MVSLLGLIQGRVEGKIEEHEEVADHADDEACDHYGVSAPLGCQMSQKPKQSSSWNFSNCNENWTQGGKCFPANNKNQILQFEKLKS